MPLRPVCGCFVSQKGLRPLCCRAGNTRPRRQPLGSSPDHLREAAGNPLGTWSQNTSVCCFDMVWLGHGWEALSRGVEMPLPQMLPPHCNKKGETEKPFLLFILIFSCLKPDGTVDDEGSALFLSDQLLSGLAAQGGSFRASQDCLCWDCSGAGRLCVAHYVLAGPPGDLQACLSDCLSHLCHTS